MDMKIFRKRLTESEYVSTESKPFDNNMNLQTNEVNKKQLVEKDLPSTPTACTCSRSERLTPSTSKNALVRSANETLSTPVQFISEKIGNMAMKYLNLNNSDMKLCDNIFGLRSEDGKDLWIGNTEVKISNNNIILNNKTYSGTKGLWELITLKEPSTSVTNNDLQNYEEIILSTYAYMQNNDKNSKRIKSSVGNKYMNFIRPILIKNKIIKEKVGSGLNSKNNLSKSLKNLKIKTSLPTEYVRFANRSQCERVYWNDIDELKDRLNLLLGEYNAGNDSPEIHNEIMNIIEELREENILTV